MKMPKNEMLKFLFVWSLIFEGEGLIVSFKSDEVYNDYLKIKFD